MKTELSSKASLPCISVTPGVLVCIRFCLVSGPLLRVQLALLVEIPGPLIQIHMLHVLPGYISITLCVHTCVQTQACTGYIAGALHPRMLQSYIANLRQFECQKTSIFLFFQLSRTLIARSLGGPWGQGYLRLYRPVVMLPFYFRPEHAYALG